MAPPQAFLSWRMASAFARVLLSDRAGPSFFLGSLPTHSPCPPGPSAWPHSPSGPQTRGAAHPPCLLIWQGEWKLSWKALELTNASQVRMLTTQALTTRAQDPGAGVQKGTLLHRVRTSYRLLPHPFPQTGTHQLCVTRVSYATQEAIVFHAPTVLAKPGPPHFAHT